MRIGVVCPSEIAARRFMPALRRCEGVEFAGVGFHAPAELAGAEGMGKAELSEAVRGEREKAQAIVDEHGGRLFGSYEAVVTSADVDAVYVPLPPALHHRWARLALECGKHVLVEKPATTRLADTRDLVRLAESRGLALQENYMFAFHDQLGAIDEIIGGGAIGDVRLYRISFGFPRRAVGDFRYSRALGGGALLDAGGYTLRYADMLLGGAAEIRYAQSNRVDGFKVDMYGSAALANAEGVTAQVSFGMDNGYRCELEVWGSMGTLTTGRVLTAPAGFVPTAIVRRGSEESVLELPADDAFLKSIRHFLKCVQDEPTRTECYRSVVRQAELVERFRWMAEGHC